MTMWSAEKRRFCGGYGEGLVHGYGDSSKGSDLVKEDELTLPTDRAESSSSKDEEWLQLQLGICSRQDPQTSPSNNGPGLVELKLMPSNSSSIRTSAGGLSPSFISPNKEMEAFRPIPISIAAPSSSSFSPYFRRPSQLYAETAAVDLRAAQPPRRPHSGIWFTLQASQNQEKEPLMPQISKSYLRIKDGRMRIRVVIKYLVNKLSFDDESEIEIRCKGERLQPLMTLQHVRDNIWSSPGNFITLLPNSSTTHHIMLLHYARIF